MLVPTREQHTRLATNVWIDILIKFNNNIRVCVCVLPLLIHMQISTQRNSSTQYMEEGKIYALLQYMEEGKIYALLF